MVAQSSALAPAGRWHGAPLSMEVSGDYWVIFLSGDLYQDQKQVSCIFCSRRILALLPQAKAWILNLKPKEPGGGEWCGLDLLASWNIPAAFWGSSTVSCAEEE